METSATSRSVNPREAGGHAVRGIDPASSLLLTDLYELNMMQAYLEAGMTEPAVFEFFVRKLPESRGFLMAAGLEQVVMTPHLGAWTADAQERVGVQVATQLADFLVDGVAANRVNDIDP